MALAKQAEDARVERVGWSIQLWGRRYGYSRSKAYQLVRTGQGPRAAMVGGELIITIEADEAWRRALADQAA
jgi:hypothetical protein